MTDPPTDDQLLRSLAGADGRAMRSLIDRHGPYLYGVARTLTRSETEAEDAVQETLMALLKATYDGRSSVRTFMVSILVRQAALLRRKRRGWLRIVSDPPESAGDANEQHAVDARLDLASLLDRLSPEHREVIVMRELEGMSYDRLSQELGIARGTVESRLHRAREQLREAWKR